MEKEEAQGQRRGIGHRPGQTYCPGKNDRIGPYALEVQPQSPAAHTARQEKQRHENKAHQGVAIVPVVVDRQHQPADGRRRLLPRPKGQKGAHAVVEYRPELSVNPVQKRRREIEQRLHCPADQAVPPCPGEDPLPDQKAHNGACVKPAGPHAGHPPQEPGQAALLIPAV